jgi:radical SAM superfamily enzyme YgiQ (UPF0313 family)
MRVAILNPLWLQDSTRFGIRSGSRWPHVRSNFFRLYPFPFQLAYASSLLRKHNHDVLFLDCIARGMDDSELLKQLSDFEPELVFHETTSPTFDRDCAVIAKIRAQHPSALIVSAGQLATTFPRKILDHSDIAIAGECELVLKELCQRIEQGREWKDIGGISYLSQGVVQSNPPALISNLDALPWPDRSGAPIKRYQENFCSYYPNASMLSSRGCPHQCSFCLESYVFNHCPNYRKRAIDDVIDEMSYLKQNYGVREIYFDDTSFTVSHERVRDMCQRILDRNLKIHWSCMADARIDFETLKLMKAAGCTGLKIGVETTNPDALDAIGKPVNNQHVQSCVQSCNKVGLFLHGTFIIGLPSETPASVDKTISFAFDSGFDWMQFSPAIPYPGTPFYEQTREKGWLLDEDWHQQGVSDNVNLSYPQLDASVIRDRLTLVRKRLGRRAFTRPRLIAKYLRLFCYLKEPHALGAVFRRLVSLFS